MVKSEQSVRPFPLIIHQSFQTLLFFIPELFTSLVTVLAVERRTLNTLSKHFVTKLYFVPILRPEKKIVKFTQKYQRPQIAKQP